MKKLNIHVDRKLYLFIALLALWAVVLLYQWNSDSVPAVSRVGSSGQNMSGDPTGSEPDPILLASRLEEETPALGEQKRNIFGFSRSAAVSAPAIVEQMDETEEPVVCGDRICDEGEDEVNCPTDCRPPEPALPPVTLRYIGFLSEGGSAVAFFTDGREVFMGREKDVVANKFRVLRITRDSVELGYLNRSETSTVRFQGSPGS